MIETQIPKSCAIDIYNSDCCSQGEIYQKDTRIFPLIQKIQSPLCDRDKNANKPDIISVGPYHNGSLNVESTEKMKCDCLSYILELNKQVELTNYIKAINRMEKKARSCYANDIQMEKKTFVKMLLLDGCFLLNTLNGLDGIVPPISNSEMSMGEQNDESIINIEFTQVDANNENHEDNSEENYRSFTKILSRDLLLLENQIPFFVVAKIYELFTGGRNPVSLLVENIVRAVEETMLACYPKAITESDRPKEFHHLLHLCHMYFKPSKEEREIGCENYVTTPSTFHHFIHFGKIFKKNMLNTSQCHDYQMEGRTLNCWRRATQYNQATIKLKKRECCDSDPHSLLDIRFCNDALTISCLTVNQETYDLFRNLIAFEQACPQFGNYITAYVIFWYHFVTTPDDVALLVEKGIIRHHLHSDKEVSDLFRLLGDGIKFDFNGDYYLKSTCNRMEEHYQIWKPRWREWLGSITSKIPSFYLKNKPELPI